MKFNHILAGALLLAAVPCAAQRINPVTKAVLDGYTEILKEDPKDYVALYQRGAQYYNLSQYEHALADVEKALRLTPQKESDLREKEYSLLADIYIQQQDFSRAYDAISSALAIEPGSYGNIYKMGNVCLYLNRPEEAYDAFRNLQRMQSRSQEAFFGMAKADIMMGNQARAEELMREAEKADPSNYVTYCRLGDLCVDLGQHENAATNYLVAYSMATDPRRPLESLVDLSRKDMAAVKSALDYAISRTDSKLPLYYMKASLSLESGNFTDAENACEELLKQPDGMDSSVYRMLAQSQHARRNYNAASENMRLAIKYRPDAANAAVMADLLRAVNPSEAVEQAGLAIKMEPDNVDAYLAGAKASLEAGDGKGALTMLNSVIMLDPGNLEALVLRGYVNSEMLGDGKLGVMDYNRAATGQAESFPDYLYQAIAKSRSGKQLDADAVIEKGLRENSGKDACYLAAVYYAQTGRLDKAKEWVERAMSLGYQNDYKLYDSREVFSLAPIRHLLRK